MYASQTKRLCVREDPSEETRSQQSSSSTEITNQSISQQQQIQSTSLNPIPTTQPSNTVSQIFSTSPSYSKPQKAIKRFCATHISLDSVSAPNRELIGFRTSQDRPQASMTAADSTITETVNDNHSPIITSNNDLANSHHQITESDKNICTKNLKHSDDYSEQDLIEKLASEVLEEAKLEIILSIRNLIIACNKKKISLVKNPNFPKLLYLLDDPSSSDRLKAESLLLICSIAKGGEDIVKVLNSLNVCEKIFNLMITKSQENFLIESCLRCLRSVMQWPSVSQSWLVYDGPSHQSQVNNHNYLNGDVASMMIKLANDSKSLVTQECVADIFATTCCRPKEQALLLKLGSLACISELMESSADRVILSALNWFGSICLKNKTNSIEATKAVCPSGAHLLSRLIELMSKDKSHELQYLSAKCFTQIYRAIMPDQMDSEALIVSHVLPTLVRLVQPDRPSKLRAESAECLAYLIECDTNLQETASICDHLIESLANMLDQDSNAVLDDLYEHYFQHFTSSNHRYLMERDSSVSIIEYRSRQQVSPHILDLRSLPSATGNIESRPASDSPASNNDASSKGSMKEYSQEMKQAAFLALAALGSSLEPIRKKIFDTCAVMQHLVKGLSDTDDPKNLKPVLTCLLSLSRSVQQLRTSFAENSVYSLLKGLLSTQSKDVLIMVLAILCNISLDFSPGKQQFLDFATISTLCSFARSTDPFLKLHAMWILMNMIYQLKDQNLKFQIMRALGIDHIQGILEQESYEELELKTLGFLRNLLSQKSHIDAIMSNYGEQIMQSLACVLERPCSNRIKEQAMCVLTNIADGSDSKALVMGNRTVLSYMAKVLSDEQAGDTRLAAICCITNLAHKDSLGSCERRDELRKFEIEDKLKSMLNSSDPILSDRARTAYNQFLKGDDRRAAD